MTDEHAPQPPTTQTEQPVHNGTETCTVRVASESDLARIADLEAAVYTAEGVWSFEDYRVDYARPGRRYLVAEHSGHLAGYAVASLGVDDADTMNLWVDALTVAPDYRRRRLGRRLLLELLEWGRAHDAATVRLHARVDNAAALALYEDLGFHVHGRRRDFYRKGVDGFELQLPM